MDVWILAGQSNMVGYNAADGTPVPPASQPLPGLVLAYGASGTWRDAVPNVHGGVHGYDLEPSVGPDMAFARTLISLGLSSRVGLVPTAKGSTSLVRDWRPGGGGGGADLYPAMIARTKAALAAPLPGGGTCRLRGMIWVQGEADAEEQAGPGPSANYGANFAAFAHAVRRDLSNHHAQLPILMGVMSVRKRSYFTYISAVRQAQLGLALTGLLRVDLAGFEFFEEYGGQHVHLTKDGCTALGAAMAHAYYSAVVRAGLPRRTGDAMAAMVTTPGVAAGPPAYGRGSGGGGGGGGGNEIAAAAASTLASIGGPPAARAAAAAGAEPAAEAAAAAAVAVAGEADAGGKAAVASDGEPAAPAVPDGESGGPGGRAGARGGVAAAVAVEAASLAAAEQAEEEEKEEDEEEKEATPADIAIELEQDLAGDLAGDLARAETQQRGLCAGGGGDGAAAVGGLPEAAAARGPDTQLPARDSALVGPGSAGGARV